ncbi:17184_t:CDS:1, partial [Gigaspora rosea]
ILFPSILVNVSRLRSISSKTCDFSETLNVLALQNSTRHSASYNFAIASSN